MQTIINKQPRMLVIHHSYVRESDGTAGGTVSFHLPPGVNFVEDSDWDVAKDDSDVKRMIKEGGIEVGAKVPSPVAALKKLSPNAAADVVDKTTSPALLDQWADTEKRGTVQTAISTQKKKLADEGKKTA